MEVNGWMCRALIACVLLIEGIHGDPSTTLMTTQAQTTELYVSATDSGVARTEIETTASTPKEFTQSGKAPDSSEKMTISIVSSTVTTDLTETTATTVATHPVSTTSISSTSIHTSGSVETTTQSENSNAITSNNEAITASIPISQTSQLPTPAESSTRDTTTGTKTSDPTKETDTSSATTGKTQTFDAPTSAKPNNSISTTADSVTPNSTAKSPAPTFTTSEKDTSSATTAKSNTDPTDSTELTTPVLTQTTAVITKNDVEAGKALSSGSVVAITVVVISLVLIIFGGVAFWKIRHGSYGRLHEDPDYGSLGNYNNPLYDDS